MVDKAVVLQTIRKMYESGIEDDVVRQTLADIGLGEQEIREAMSAAKSGARPAESEEPEEEAGSAYSAARPDLREQLAQQHAAQEAMHTTTHAAMEGHAAKLDELGEKIGGVEESLGKIHSLTESPSNRDLVELIAVTNQKLALLEKQVSDLKALTKALQSVMEKILETDRSILGKL